MADSKKVKVPQLDLVRFPLKIVGKSPMIQHKFSQKAKTQIADKQQGKAKQKKAPKVPAQDWIDSMYWISEKPELPDDPDEAYEVAKEAVNDGARFGMRSIAFKLAAVGGARFVDGIPMTHVRGAFHVNGELTELDSDPPVMREDSVTIGRGQTDLRYRGEFRNWSATLDIELNRRAITVEQLVLLLNSGGFGQGVGDWRPEKGGSFGRFEVATSEEEIEAEIE